jgi:hypothetical protein
MKKKYLLILIFGLLCCSEKRGENVVSNSTDSLSKDSLANLSNKKNSTVESTTMIGSITSAELDLTKIECMPQPFYHESNDWSFFFPGTFVEKTYVYNSIKPKAKIIDTLQFGTPVNILSEYPEFFLVCMPHAKAGYVKKTNLYFNSFGGTHLFGISKYGTNDNISCRDSQLKVIKIDDKVGIVDVYYDSIMGNAYTARQIYECALKNTVATFHLTYGCYSGMGVTVDHFIIDNGKLSRLIREGSSGDGGYSEICSVYIPIRLTAGTKIVLAKNGQLGVDSSTGKVEIYPYPKTCGIPIDELIIVESKSEEMLWDDEKGMPKVNNDGTVAVNISYVETTYYRWNGKSLQKVKTVIND